MTSSPGAQVRYGLLLEYSTLVLSCLEGIFALVLAVLSGSVSLAGFGLDSAIEFISGAALVWRLRSHSDPTRRERADRIALRIVGCCFFALALYICYESGRKLLLHDTPHPSFGGIVLAAASMFAMPVLARAKRNVAGGIGSAALAADAKQTELCGYLSAILLAGLVLNALLAWWWADPLAGLLMVPIIGREGYNALQGRACHCGSD